LAYVAAGLSDDDGNPHDEKNCGMKLLYGFEDCLNCVYIRVNLKFPQLICIVFAK
jgi:hypothetical protein